MADPGSIVKVRDEAIELKIEISMRTCSCKMARILTLRRNWDSLYYTPAYLNKSATECETSNLFTVMREETRVYRFDLIRAKAVPLHCSIA